MKTMEYASGKKAAAKKKVAAKAPAKVETVTLRHLALALAEAHELPKKQANELMNELVVMITKHLKKGARIRIGGLGVLQVRKRPARMGRNPATGETIKIKASKKVAFRAAKELKESI
jgi:DNA-binding protein HU-beta